MAPQKSSSKPPSADPPTGDASAAERRSPGDGRPRRSRRLPLPGVLVAIDAPGLSSEPWVVDAIDINADGLGLVLPDEVPENTAVELTFRLPGGGEFSRLPAVVRHQRGSSGGVRFGSWPERERLALLEFLVERYEHGEDERDEREEVE